MSRACITPMSPLFCVCTRENVKRLASFECDIHSLIVYEK